MFLFRDDMLFPIALHVTRDYKNRFMSMFDGKIKLDL